MCVLILSTCVRAMRCECLLDRVARTSPAWPSGETAGFLSDGRLGAISTGFPLPAVPVEPAANGRHFCTLVLFMLGGLLFM